MLPAISPPSPASRLPLDVSCAAAPVALEGYQLELEPDVTVHTSGGARCPVPLQGEREGFLGLRLEPGEALETPWMRIGRGYEVEVVMAAGPHAGGAEAELGLHADRGALGMQPLAQLALPSGMPAPWRRVVLSLQEWQDRRVRLRVACRAGGGRGSVTLALLRVCDPARAGRLNALSSYAWRLRNEVHHFSGSAYTHAMYGAMADGPQRGTVRPAVPVRREQDAAQFHALEQRAWRRVVEIAPLPQEAAFNHALRALTALLPVPPPSFLDRARRLSESKPLRILSLCAGSARVEEQLLDHCQGEVDLTLLDASTELAQRAADRLARGGARRQVHCLVGDINDGLPGSGTYDVILCVSALHHVADLETVLSQVNERLAPDGEFWSIGEQVGRNGNRLWPEAAEAANRAFSVLPERLRLNAVTGRVDEVITDRDCSANCFEGVRSEELPALLDAYLMPVQVYQRNAFLWRLTDAAYNDNYHLDREDDLRWLRSLVVAEAVHWACGGRSTELHGIFRKKLVG